MNPQTVLLILSSLSHAITLARQVREDLQQKGEWTVEQEAEFQKSLDATANADHWRKSTA